MQRAQQRVKDYYDQGAKEPIFVVGQHVWVYTPWTKKGLSRKLLHNWLGPYRIVEQASPVHFRLRTDTNKTITFALHANRMKPFIDPSLRPLEPPLFDDPSEPYLMNKIFQMTVLSHSFLSIKMSTLVRQLQNLQIQAPILIIRTHWCSCNQILIIL